MKRLFFRFGRAWIAATLLIVGIATAAAGSDEIDAGKIVRGNFDYMRGKASESVAVMTIFRPDWKRSRTIQAWTKGTGNSLFVIAAPPKDEGNGTLKKGNEMWMYNPKINRVVKVPPSMMAQPWMGSDFSNNDLAKSDTILEDYNHSVEKTETVDGMTVYHIKSMPKPGAPVVWGMQRLVIREDSIPLKQTFYDEDFEAVKTLSFTNLKMLGGKLFPARMKMEKTDAEEKYTLVEYQTLTFSDSLPNSRFTLSALRRKKR